MKFYFPSPFRLFLYRYVWVFALYALCSCQGSPTSEIPALDGKMFKGTSVSLQELSKGKVTFVNIWNTFCGPCLQEMPALHNIYNKYRGNNRVAFVSIAFNSEEELNQFNAQKDTANPYKIAFQASQLDSFYLPTLAVSQKGNKTLQVNGSWAAHPADTAEMNKVFRMFNIDGIPTTLIYDAEGKLVRKIPGLRTEEYYYQLIDGLLTK